jgi:hypothetical protein
MELTPERAKILEDCKTILSAPNTQFVIVGFHPAEGGTQAVLHSRINNAALFVHLLVETQQLSSETERPGVVNLVSSIASVFMTASVMVNKNTANITIDEIIGHIDSLFNKQPNKSTNVTD